jgi:hypothetical protein
MNDFIPVMKQEEMNDGDNGGLDLARNLISQLPKDLLIKDDKGNNNDDNEGDDNNFDQKIIDKIINTPDDQRSDEEKQLLEKHKDSDKKDDDEQIEITEDQIAKIKAKKPEELTDDEKEILNQLNDDSGEDSTIGFLKNNSGFEELKDKNYTNDSKGYQELISDIRQVAGKKEVENILNEFPLMAELYTHVYKEGKGVDSFFMKNQAPEHTTFDIETEEGQKSLLHQSLSKRGIDKDVIDTIIEKYENEGKLKEKAKSEFDLLDKQHKDSIAAREQEEKQEYEKQLKLQQEVDKEINSVLKSGKILGISLDTKQASEFQKYILDKDSETGLPKSVVDYNNLSVEKQLFINYLMYSNFNVKGIETEKIKEKELGKLGKEGKKRYFVKKSNDSVKKTLDDLRVKGLQKFLN